VNIKRFFAKHGLITNGVRFNIVSESFYKLMVGVADLLTERLGDEGEHLLVNLMEKFGAEDGKKLKEELNLGDSLEDAADAWLIMGNVFKVKMIAKKLNKNEIEFHHPYCPMWNFFKSKGKIYCKTLCLPYVESFAKAVSPNIEMVIVQPPTEENTCIKKLVVKS